MNPIFRRHANTQMLLPNLGDAIFFKQTQSTHQKIRTSSNPHIYSSAHPTTTNLSQFEFSYLSFFAFSLEPFSPLRPLPEVIFLLLLCSYLALLVEIVPLFALALVVPLLIDFVVAADLLDLVVAAVDLAAAVGLVPLGFHPYSRPDFVAAVAAAVVLSLIHI